MDSPRAQKSSKRVVHTRGSSPSQASPEHIPYSSSVPVTTGDSKELSTFTYVDSDEETTPQRSQQESIESCKPSEDHNLLAKERTDGKKEGIHNNRFKQEELGLETKKRQTSSPVLIDIQKPDMSITSEPEGKIRSAAGEQRNNPSDSKLLDLQALEKKNSTYVSAGKGTRSAPEAVPNLQRKAKSLSFLKETSPRKVEDIGSYSVTAVAEANNPSGRMRGRTASRKGSKQKRSQTPAAPALNLSDYGSDDDIEASDLAESACVYDGKLARKKVQKPSVRFVKPPEKVSSILRQRKHTPEAQQTPSCVPGQNNKNSSTCQKASVTFNAKEDTIQATVERKSKVQCHTPFPRGNPMLLTSESEDSDDPSFQENRISNSDGASLRAVDDHSGKSLDMSRGDEQPTPAAPLRSMAWTGKGICFTRYPNMTSPRGNHVRKSRDSGQASCFVRIGGRRNILTFEPAIETTNILPAVPTKSKPALVPGSYCSSCGQRVLDY